MEFDPRREEQVFRLIEQKYERRLLAYMNRNWTSIPPFERSDIVTTVCEEACESIIDGSLVAAQSLMLDGTLSDESEKQLTSWIHRVAIRHAGRYLKKRDRLTGYQSYAKYATISNNPPDTDQLSKYIGRVHWCKYLRQAIEYAKKCLDPTSYDLLRAVFHGESYVALESKEVGNRNVVAVTVRRAIVQMGNYLEEVLPKELLGYLPHKRPPRGGQCGPFNTGADTPGVLFMERLVKFSRDKHRNRKNEGFKRRRA